ncbi:HDR017Cp [Eremothecium sinecaudum]|uniref:HDR017Cp n=1 Tax=Eremothecium sinecaudum TaxID=45286 RepID=A0A109UZ27_9SACH|nr:HDR017Cp [Eremothecium sinecaudum]AMD20760.1 HDR017Cp [Eremothecium sinecaudum]
MKASAIFSASALLALASAQSKTEQEIAIVLKDILDHRSDYLRFQLEHPDIQPPEGLLPVYEAYKTRTDDSYTTLFSNINVDQFHALVTALPWYSERIVPAFATIVEAGGATEAPEATAVPESAEAPEPTEAPTPAAPEPTEAPEAPEAPAPESTPEAPEAPEAPAPEEPEAPAPAAPAGGPVASAVAPIPTGVTGNATTGAPAAPPASTTPPVVNPGENAGNINAWSTALGVAAAGVIGMLL